MSVSSIRSPLVPDEAEASAADAALQRLKPFLAAHSEDREISFRVDGEDDLSVPREAVELLARVLAHMAAGEGVTILPARAELTTQQAADILNVSRPYLIKLLDCGAIDFRLVGKHRRIRLDSLMDYMREDDRKRRKAAVELSSLTQEMGLV